MNGLRFSLVLAALALARPASAQVTVTLTASGPTAVSTGASIPVSANNSSLTVTCQGVDCTQLSLRVQSSGGLSPVPKGTFTATAAAFTLNASLLRGSATGDLLFVVGSSPLGSVPLKAAAGAVTDTATAASPSLGTLLTSSCGAALARYNDADLYDAAGNWAQFVVTPLGNVIHRPADLVDENDRVRVVVVGDDRLIPRLKVTRQSAFRMPGSINIVGQGSDLQFNFKAAVRCDSAAFVLADFAPGQGQVQIAVVNPDGSQTNTGSFDFAVHKLYTGAFALGAIRTALRDPTFGVAVNGADSVLTQTADGTPRLLYVLSYTHFIWGKRDIEKPAPWYQHVNPMVGVVLSDIKNNGVAGVSVDLANGLYLQGGIHAGRVTRLDPQSGLKLGDRFTGPASSIPTVREWDVDWFAGVSLDVRAAVELLRVAVTGAKTGS